ncbi:YheC/YheD family protein [Metabacillus halosaccharovorans]|nr:YheC/YheD family protein [Metabacillus halosaccharovorans]
MHKWFSQDSLLKQTLPSTKICSHPNEILDFLKKYKRAYFKPIGGTFAQGIIILSYHQQGVSIQYEKKRNIVTHTFYKKIEFKKFFKKILRRGDYLIQEAISLLTSENRVIDFRFIYIKNIEGTWEDNGLFARYGKLGSGISNLTRGGTPKEGIAALKEFLLEEEVNQKLEEMKLIAEKASLMLEKKLIQCGNLGFDFGIDINNKLWIIEINNEDPDHRIATVCKRKDILYNARLQNMLFAKKLAGF